MFKDGALEGNVTPCEVRYCIKPGCWQVGVTSGAVNVMKTSGTDAVDDCVVLDEDVLCDVEVDVLWDDVVVLGTEVLETENPVQGQPL